MTGELDAAFPPKVIHNPGEVIVRWLVEIGFKVGLEHKEVLVLDSLATGPWGP
jgi:hypothetical protein